MHSLIQARRAADNRKVWRCTVCTQEWRDSPSAFCPGVPVVPWSDEHGHLRTKTQAAKERIILPGDAKPVAALRGQKEYFWLYDVSHCKVKSLTGKERRRNERREATIAERYGCKRCTKRYLKREQQWFTDGVCWECRMALRSWYEVVQRARGLVAQETPILVLETDVVNLVLEPGMVKTNSLLYRWRDPKPLRYQVCSLLDGSVSSEHDLTERQGYASLVVLCSLVATQGTETPLFVCPTSAEIDILWNRLLEHKFPVVWEWKRLLVCLPSHGLIPQEPKGWISFPDADLPREQYFTEFCRALDLPTDGTLAEQLSRIILHLAKQPLEDDL